MVRFIGGRSVLACKYGPHVALPDLRSDFVRANARKHVLHQSTYGLIDCILHNKAIQLIAIGILSIGGQ
ncbi:hypothetical protein, partial [Roseibium sp. RKSG952]|uniref:hypothetical protein n=1 Tax=Roseibium sp. RKSG952 TaxID=2529384 RepID=UPI001AD93A69